jgi:hypothetical protein
VMAAPHRTARHATASLDWGRWRCSRTTGGQTGVRSECCCSTHPAKVWARRS